MDQHSRGRSHLAAIVEGQRTVVVGDAVAVAAAAAAAAEVEVEVEVEVI